MNLLKSIKFPNSNAASIIFLLFVYVVVFGPNAISVVESVEFMGADAHSIVDSLKVLTTTPYYNMNDPYHSKYYGWTYFSLNFVTIMIAKLFGIVAQDSINLLIRANLFIIGAASVSMAYLVLRKFFNLPISLFCALYFMVEPVASHFLILIHPESTGLLFQLLGVYFLLACYEKKQVVNYEYYLAVLFLSLSALAKQPFLIVNVFLGVCFLWFFTRKHSFGIMTFINLLFQAIIIFLACFFVIHPYAFIQYDRFLESQIYLSKGHSSRDLYETFVLWINAYFSNLIFSTHLFCLCFSFLIKDLSKLYRISLWLVFLVSLIFAFNSRLYINVGYLFPLYPLAIFNIAFFANTLLEKKTIFGRLFLLSTIILFATVNIMTNFSYTVFALHHRFFADGLTTSKVSWDYIKTLDNNHRIVYSPNVAMPQPFKSNGCQAWQGCNDYGSIEKLQPSAIVFSPDYHYFNSSDFKKYIEQNGFSLAKTIKPNFASGYNCFNTSAMISYEKDNKDLATFNFLNVPSSLNNIGNCFESYKTLLEQNREQAYTGLPIHIYVK